jgi:2-polyprenyl-3-methyl-5-hydroxy-6-metoxy-1,4-benzoquinol methylase
MPDVDISAVLSADPKHLVFTLARYKFVAKMFSGMRSVLEVGCGNGFGAAIVAQNVGSLHCTDPDVSRTGRIDGIKYSDHDILSGSIPNYDGVFCLDVFEHIADEETLLHNLADCAPVCIIGTPSLESQAYASADSKAHHVNCKSGEVLRACLRKHWPHVFIFGMNDETLHTGFLPMSHYLLALCVK